MRLAKRKAKIGTLLTVATLLAIFATPLHAAVWKTLAPKDGGFTIGMPGTPKATKTAEKDQDGEVTTNYDWSLESETTYYMVGYQEHPVVATRLVNPDAILDEAITGLTGGKNKSKNNSVKKLKLNGAAGREVSVTTPDGVQLHGKVFWVKRRLYMAMAGFPSGDANAAKDATRFLNSFKLSSKP